MSDPTGLLDTNIFSALEYTGGLPAARAMHLKTREWWALERPAFVLFSSKNATVELSRGKYPGQAKAIAAAKRLPILRETNKVDELAQRYIDKLLIPPNEMYDAIHLALATINRIDYLLTWNYAHLGGLNAERLNELHSKLNLRSPLIVSPDNIPWSSLGQQVRRKDK